MNTDLQKIYDEWGGEKSWEHEINSRDSGWVKAGAPGVFAINYESRLVPRLPEGLPDPNDDMMNRAVYLCKGPVKKPKGVDRFSDWILGTRGDWLYSKTSLGTFEYQYCIDIRDPHAREIIELNRPGLLDDEKILDGGGLQKGECVPYQELLIQALCIIQCGWQTEEERKVLLDAHKEVECYGRQLIEERLQQAATSTPPGKSKEEWIDAFNRMLSEAGPNSPLAPGLYLAVQMLGGEPVIEPSEHDWIPLSECRVDVKEDNGNWYHYATDKDDDSDWEQIAIAILRYGPESVRVRLKRSKP
ncbi:MAG: hypothetical protein ACOC8P_00445 [Dichotomicrobium sp.]